jgi:hypothetical protein
VSEGESYQYRAEILDALLVHGVRPDIHTRPTLVHEFVRDLYRHEIRRLRERLLRNEFPRREYAARVIELRKRYWITSRRPEEWVE